MAVPGEVIGSVGIDVGTSTTELVFSRLQIENLAGATSVPRIEIVDRKIVHRSAIHRTPLVRPDLIDAAALRTLVLAEYQRAGIQPQDLRTGAAIITGETARAENAEQVLVALSELAGDFVVATAGPELESVLAARGAGIDRYSEHSGTVVANLDIGGGTTNLAVYRHGRLLGTSCMDIGGRLVRIADGQISYIYDSVARLAAANRLEIAVGDRADVDRLRVLARLMARQLAMAVGLITRDELHPSLYTNAGVPLPEALVPEEISFSGGVADLIGPANSDWFRYGDIGVLFGEAIAEESAFSLVKRHRGTETIAATVVGAGVHTTEVSGSTIEYATGVLPLRNVPIVRIDPDSAADPDRLADQFGSQLRVLGTTGPGAAIAIAFSGHQLSSFDRVQAYAEAIIRCAGPILAAGGRLVIVLEADRAKVLGQSLAVQRGRRDDVICIDGVQTSSADYIDIGLPVGAGRAVPVVLKTLVFNV